LGTGLNSFEYKIETNIIARIKMKILNTDVKGERINPEEIITR